MKYKEKKKVFMILLLLTIALVLRGILTSDIKDGEISRNEPGGGEKERTLEAKVGENKYEIKIEAWERQYTKKEAKKNIEKAKKEIEQIFLGKNDSLDHVNQKVIMKTDYQEGAVKAEWSLDRYDIIDSTGNFIKTELPKNGILIEARVRLLCAEVVEEYQFVFHVYSPKLSMEKQIERAVRKEEEKSRTETTLKLPKKIRGEKIIWKEKTSHSILLVLLLGPVIAVLFKIRGIEEERKKKKKREAELILSYPQFVMTLALLIGAGMSVSKAWERMSKRYKTRDSEKRIEVYEELCFTWNEIQDGIGERIAYENFGRRCALPQYKKLASILTQNLKKGTAGIAELLTREAEFAQEQRKNMAKKLGEEAGTKLLLPMMLMLAIIMVIIVVPAVISFQ